MKIIKKLPTKIALFPLPNFIIFPKTSVPLNIFEPRYIDMINDCMKENRIFGMIQPKKQIKDLPELYSIGCAGKITSFNETEDGKYLIVINGVSRFRILKEISNNKSYRECEVNFEDFNLDLKDNDQNIKLGELDSIFKNLKSLFEKKGYIINWKELEKKSLEQTINTLAMASPFSLEEKQALLETKDINLRKISFEKILNTYVTDNFSNTTLQ
jgi:Lon protease-like protein